MNRRIFAKTVLGGMGASLLATHTVAASKSIQNQAFEKGLLMQTEDGIKMTLVEHQHPTANQDRKQFVLTFDVQNNSSPLEEKVYQLKDHKGKKHQIYMSPIERNRLQAVFNWRTHV